MTASARRPLLLWPGAARRSRPAPETAAAPRKRDRREIEKDMLASTLTSRSLRALSDEVNGFQADCEQHARRAQSREMMFICDLTLFQAPSSRTTSFPTIPQSAGSSPNFKVNIQWSSSSAAEG